MRAWSSCRRTTGIDIVATNDCHFHRREDTFAHKVLIGIGLNRELEDLQRGYAYNAEFYVKSPAEMYELFSDYPGACERTVEIASRCHVRFDTDTLHLPKISGTGRFESRGFSLPRKREIGLKRRLG